MKMVILGVFLFNLASCTTASVTNLEPEQLSSLEINRINELFRIQAIVGKEVWPGFEIEKFRFILVGQKNQWAINVEPLPSYYKALVVPESLNKQVTSLAVTEKYRNEFGEKLNEAPEILYNAYSKEMTGMHFNHSIYLVKTLDEYHRIGDKQAAEEWIHISLHELFHSFQDKYVNYTSDFLKAIVIPLKKSIVKDTEHTELLKPEVELLAKAACSTSIKETKKYLKHSLQLRKKRWLYIEKKYQVKPERWERYDSWAEGTAHYVEHQIMSRVSAYKNDTLLVGDPFFNKFNNYTEENKSTWCSRVASNKKRSYWYSLGFSYALILDKLIPDWKTKDFDKNLFFDNLFKKLNLI